MTYLFKDFCDEIVIGNPETEGCIESMYSLRSMLRVFGVCGVFSHQQKVELQRN